MLAALYKTKKDLKASIGKPLRYQETSMFGAEFDPNGKFAVVGPSPYERKWYASVTMKDGLIYKVNPAERCPHCGGQALVYTAYGDVVCAACRKSIYAKKNIARKADVPWREPAVQAHWQAGFHTAWDEPEDHPQYPMAGDIQKTMMRKSEWDAIQARRRRMYGREKMNPAPYFGTYDYEEEPEIYCPACGGEPQYMGTLGDRDWFRCRRCGWQFAMKSQQENPASMADIIAIYETPLQEIQILVRKDPRYTSCYSIDEYHHGSRTDIWPICGSQEALNDKLFKIMDWYNDDFALVYVRR